MPILSGIGSSRLCVIIFAYGTLKCLLGKTFRTILRIFYRYRPRFHTETRRARNCYRTQIRAIKTFINQPIYTEK
ncbi:Alkaline phosphatase [Microcystis panniformis FACHB-1757]|uniref:Alkaline phosphatase n=1 Tax=Microcystis panniformis FACHB-1757 TaxID=1638788 RepID=A0A0K1SAD4_9CHRO|nr:Alkaline phosphatase [Microcystis panniformis FACHB-1757]